jgi:hypothetical protein
MSKLNTVAADFAGQIAIAVWLGKLTEEAAHEALGSYAMACHQARRTPCLRLREALVIEYRRRRERQDACS